MPGWLNKIFTARTAVQAGRDNPVLRSAVDRSSRIYEKLPLREFIDEEARKILSRHLFLTINEICNAIDPVITCREKLSVTMLEFSLYQVLVIPPAPENDPSELRGQPGISGELSTRIFSLASKNGELARNLRSLVESKTPDSVRRFVLRSYWTSYWVLESINAVRIELGDYDENDDWYRPFMHAACAKREHSCRRDLSMPSNFSAEIAEIAPTAYSIFTDIVLSGSRNPAEEWREYYRDSGIPNPVFDESRV